MVLLPRTRQHQGLNIAAQGCSEWKLCLCTPLGRKPPCTDTECRALQHDSCSESSARCPEDVLVSPPCYSDGIKTQPPDKQQHTALPLLHPHDFTAMSVVVSSQQGTGQCHHSGHKHTRLLGAPRQRG